MGKVFVWGGSTLAKPTLVSFLANMNVIQVGASNSDMFYVLTDAGDVFMFSIQDVSNNNIKNFKKIDFELGVKEKVIMIATADSGVLSLTNFGKILTYLVSNKNTTGYELNIFNPKVGIDSTKIVKIITGGHDSFILERESGKKTVAFVRDTITGNLESTDLVTNFIATSGNQTFYTDNTDETILHLINNTNTRYNGRRREDPREHLGSSNWIGGSVRRHHSLFVSDQGFVYSLGKNFETLLCGETIMEDKKITKLSVLRNVENVYQCKDSLEIHGGNKHYFSLARTKTGQLFSWGGNGDMQLGISSDRKYAIFPCLITALYGMKIAQADCGNTVAIALSDNYSTAFSELLNKEALSDLKIELYANNTSETKDIYLHKCILLARCPTLLKVILDGKMSYLLRKLLMNSQADYENHQTPESVNNLEKFVSRIDCSDYEKINEDYIENVHKSLLIVLQYLYVDNLDFLSLDLEKNRETVAMVQKIISFFYFLELSYFNDESFVSYSMVQSCNIDPSVFKSFEEWNFSSKKLENMNTNNRMVRAFALDSSNSNIDSKFAEQRIGSHILSLLGKEDTCEDYKLSLQSKDGSLNVSLPLHKVILSNSIEFFKGVFESNMEEEKRGEMHLAMESSEDFYLFQLENVIPLLFHAYCGSNPENADSLFMNEINTNLTLTNACECLAVANYFASREFKASCENFISKYISIENVVSLFLVCETHEAYSLKELSIDFAASHFESVQLYKEFHDEISEEIQELVKKLARKRSKKILDRSTLEKYWNNEINEQDLLKPKVASSSSTVSSTTSSSSTAHRTRKPSIFSKIFKIFQ